MLVTISNKPVQEYDQYIAEVLSAQDYYPFGMLQPDRRYSPGSYRYGFNGKENENEVKEKEISQITGIPGRVHAYTTTLQLTPLKVQF